MNRLLKFTNLYDSLIEKLGIFSAWTVLLAAVISAANTVARYGFDLSSTGWLEIQWYLFAATVMLGAPTVLKRNEHLRVVFIYKSIPSKAQVYIDLFGLLIFLLPVMGFMVWLSFPLFLKMLLSGEVSSNAGGLVRWPAMMLLPLGFSFIWLQGICEIIKRVAHLSGLIKIDTLYVKPAQ
jgi:TRAP-type mannitol/chloroaromatic compound transport system permease small subunit